jgi:hypothetical protein
MQQAKWKILLIIAVIILFINYSLQLKAGKSHSKKTHKNKSKKTAVAAKNTPYNTDKARDLFKSIAKQVFGISSWNPFTTEFEVCCNKVDETALKSFWDSNLDWTTKSQQGKYPINLVISIMQQLDNEDTEKKECAFEPKIGGDQDSFKIILNRIFGISVSEDNNTGKKFIHGMVSHHRRLINKSTFENINKVSNGINVDTNSDRKAYQKMSNYQEEKKKAENFGSSSSGNSYNNYGSSSGNSYNNYGSSSGSSYNNYGSSGGSSYNNYGSSNYGSSGNYNNY